MLLQYLIVALILVLCTAYVVHRVRADFRRDGRDACCAGCSHSCCCKKTNEDCSHDAEKQ